MKKVNLKRMTNQLLFGLFGLLLTGGVLLNTQEAFSKNQEEQVNAMTVRMPVAVLCPNGTRYYTKCQGSGEGCDMTDCDTDPSPGKGDFYLEP